MTSDWEIPGASPEILRDFSPNRMEIRYRIRIGADCGENGQSFKFHQGPWLLQWEPLITQMGVAERESFPDSRIVIFGLLSHLLDSSKQ